MVARLVEVLRYVTVGSGCIYLDPHGNAAVRTEPMGLIGAELCIRPDR